MTIRLPVLRLCCCSSASCVCSGEHLLVVGVAVHLLVVGVAARLERRLLDRLGQFGIVEVEACPTVSAIDAASCTVMNVL